MLAQRRGPAIAHYAICQDTGDLYHWIVDDDTEADGFNVLGHSGGVAGRWHRVVPDRHGDDLANEDATIVVADGLIRAIPASTLTDDRTITISADGAKPGDEIEIVRQDTSANSVSVVDGVTSTSIALLDAGLAQTVRFRFRTAGWYQIGALLHA